MVFFASVFPVVGCDKEVAVESVSSVSSLNKSLLDQANDLGGWFHAKKTRPIWAKKLQQAQTVKTIEGEEKVEAGHFLCRGEAGDIWPQTEKDLLKRYVKMEEVTSDGWTKCTPNPDANGVMAIQINHPFEVHASWGLLKGKPGDFLLKNFEDRNNTLPSDLWIVDQKLFGETYSPVSE